MNNCWTRKANHTEGSTTGNTEYSCQHTVKKDTALQYRAPSETPLVFGTGVPVTQLAHTQALHLHTNPCTLQ